jgi:hypothetical protein
MYPGSNGQQHYPPPPQGYPQYGPAQHGPAQHGPAQYGPPHGYPPPVAPPRRSAGGAGPKVAGCLVVVVIIVGLAVVGVGAAAGWFSSADAASEAKVGDCLKATGPGPKTSAFAIVSCTAPDAAYKVAVRGGRRDSCPDLTYGAYGEREGKRSGFTLCLMLNAKQGDCFQQTVDFPTGQATKVACGAGATYRVTKVVEGTADKSACGRNASTGVSNDFSRPRALVYQTPPTTICTDKA